MSLSRRSMLGMLSLVGMLCGFLVLVTNALVTLTRHKTPRDRQPLNSFPTSVFIILHLILIVVYFLMMDFMPSATFWSRYQPVGCFLLSITFTISSGIIGTSLWTTGSLPNMVWLLSEAYNITVFAAFAAGWCDDYAQEDAKKTDEDFGDDDYAYTQVGDDDLEAPLMQTF